ncbi:aminodeoxychorismate lyase [Acidipropionibacterium acidipropionici]|jgi:4-amino-4-deoxychorismate lyase|nr:aminodeoxychorismate lyase [Acidipropionibacterium acidipropionici]
MTASMTSTTVTSDVPALVFVDDLAEGFGAPARPFHGASPFHRADPASTPIDVLDLGITRGDGVFETAGVNHGHPQAIDAHLARMARSAALLDLPAPRIEVWRRAVQEAIEAWGSDGHGAAKLIYTRGIEGTGVPTGWVYVWAEEPEGPIERRDGITVVLLDRGYRSDVAKTSPWLLQGAKTLSYALNQATLREAQRRGADDAVYTSTDGFLLEGPHASLILRFGDEFITPGTDQGILKGTTQGDAFDWLEGQGYGVGARQVRVEEFAAADAAWLVSSVRCAVPITRVDDREMAIDRQVTDGLNAFLLERDC